MMNAESVKARLKNVAIERGHLYQEELLAYGLERTIYRISISNYMDKFALKGGMFLYALFERDFTRVTTDIDLLAQKLNNEVDSIKKIFEEIFLIEVDDALQYNLKTLQVISTIEFKFYHGINVKIVANLDKTKIPVSIDIGFGDRIYPERVLMEFPVILDMEAPKIYAYSLYSVIAEKFEAIVSLGYANSRYKDFYDIYILHKLRYYECKTDILKKAIEQTCQKRGSIAVISQYEVIMENIQSNQSLQNFWSRYQKEFNYAKDITFENTCNAVLEIMRGFDIL